MKKIISLVLILSMLFSLSITASAATTEKVDITYRAIKLVLDGEQFIPCDENGKTVEPFIMNSSGTTYLPLRALAQALGLTVGWDSKTSTVTLTSGGEVKTGSGNYIPSTGTRNVTITYRDIKVVLDGKQLELVNSNGESVEPFIMNSTTYLPLRTIGEALGLKINWDPSSSTVGIAQPEKPDEPSGEGSWEISKVVYTTNIPGDISYSYVTEYYPDGSVKSDSLSSEDGVSLTAKYDEMGNDIYLEYNDGAYHTTDEWAYDDQGRLVFHSYLDHNENHFDSQEYTYGSGLRPVSVTHTYTDAEYTDKWISVYHWDGDTADVTSYDYEDRDFFWDAGIYTLVLDAEGRVIKEGWDMEGYSWQCEFAYDQWDNLTKEAFSDSDGVSYSILWAYDENGNPLSCINVNGDYSYSESYTYNSRGQETGRVFVENGTTICDGTTSYFEDGRTAGMRTVTPDGTTESTYNYDENGVLVSIIDVFIGNDGSFSTLTITFEYDEYGNVIKETGDDGTSTYTYEYSYVFIGG